MRGLTLALRALSRHLWRTIITVLLFSIALGTLTFVLSPLLFDAPNHYLNVLAKNDVKGILIESYDQKNPEETVKKYLPENHRIFKVEEDFTGGTGIRFQNSEYSGRTAAVFGVGSSDFEDMGFGKEFGEYPKQGEYAISLAFFERLKQEGLTQIYDESGLEQTRTFSTFEELQELLKLQKRQNLLTNEIEPNPIIVSGVVDTKYNEKKEAELRNAVSKADQYDREAAEKELSSYVQNFGKLYVFAHDTTNQTAGTDLFLTSLPKDKSERKALFQAIEAKNRSLTGLIQGNDGNDKISILEEHYTAEFFDIVTSGYAASILVLPVAILFLILSFVMMLNLASKCGKSSAAEIGEQRARGMRPKDVYGVSLLRSVIVALISFVVSVGFAYLCRLVFQTGGIVDRVMPNFIEGWNGAEQNLVNFNYFEFLPFFIAFAYGLVVALFASIAGYRKTRTAPAVEDDVSEAEDE